MNLEGLRHAYVSSFDPVTQQYEWVLSRYFAVGLDGKEKLISVMLTNELSSSYLEYLYRTIAGKDSIHWKGVIENESHSLP